MPRYDYKCMKCQKEFELSLSLSERESDETPKKICPSCGAKQIDKLIGRGSGGILKHGQSKSTDRPSGCGGCSSGGCPYSG